MGFVGLGLVFIPTFFGFWVWVSITHFINVFIDFKQKVMTSFNESYAILRKSASLMPKGPNLSHHIQFHRKGI